MSETIEFEVKNRPKSQNSHQFLPQSSERRVTLAQTFENRRVNGIALET
ncbi:hypothetical protein HMPREF0577_0064 [Mobiluncus mulieris ATCC 35243]|nr:hypothetical protein HMPREF0577_0064 [Mobiluncus mulieris ATCC 35243]